MLSEVNSFFRAQKGSKIRTQVIGALFRRPFVQKLLGSVFSQGMLSITSFLIGVSIARHAAKYEYGMYVVCFSVIQMFNSLQNALVNTPLTVLLPEKEKNPGQSFLSGLALGQWFIFVPVLIVCSSSVFFQRWFQDDYGVKIALILLLFTIPMSYVREFVRVVHYCRLKVQSILTMDITFVAGAIMGMCFLVITGKITASNTILVLGGSYLFSGWLGHMISKEEYRFNISWVKESFRETWQYSRWSLLGIAVTNAQTYGSTWIISLFLGLASTADVSAARLLMMPFGFCIHSTQRIFLAKGSQVLLHDGQNKFRRLFLFFVLSFTCIWVLYVLFLVFFHEGLISTVLTGKYGNIGVYLSLLSIIFLINAYVFLANLSLQIFREFKYLAICGLASAVFMLSACIYLSMVKGLIGSLFAVILGNAALGILLGARLVKLLTVNRCTVPNCLERS